jgi:hypothetical protein
MLDEGDTIKVRLLADINDIELGVFDEGDGLTASIDNDDTDADDQNGDELSSTELTGSVTGEAQTFFTEGIRLTLVSVSESLVPEDGTPDVGTFVIKYKVSAFETDAYLQEDCGTLTASGSEFVLDIPAALEDCALTSTADDDGANGNFEVLDGQDEEFTLTVTASGTGAFNQLLLSSVEWSTTDIADPLQVYSTNLDDFETDPLFLSST